MIDDDEQFEWSRTTTCFRSAKRVKQFHIPNELQELVILDFKIKRSKGIKICYFPRKTGDELINEK